MRVGTVFSVVIYCAIVVLAGAFLLAVATNYISYDMLQAYIHYLYMDAQLKLYLGVLGGLLIFLSLLLFHVAIGRVSREKKVTIKSKDGLTQIALFPPVDNIVKEVANALGTIIDVRQDVYKWKKGIRIDARLAMKPGVNIKDVSDAFKEKVIEKVRQAIGIEGPIEVNVYVWKISDGKKRRQAAKQEQNFSVPYREMDV